MHKSTELRDRIAQLTAQIQACDQYRQQLEAEAVKAFEVSQTLKEKRLLADFKEKRQILETLCLNFTLNTITFDMTMRKSFDMFVKGHSVPLNRGDMTAIELFLAGIRGWKAGVWRRMGDARFKIT